MEEGLGIPARTRRVQPVRIEPDGSVVPGPDDPDDPRLPYLMNCVDSQYDTIDGHAPYTHLVWELLHDPLGARGPAFLVEMEQLP